MDIEKLIGKYLCLVLIQNGSDDSITGKVFKSKYGDDVLNICNDDDEEYQVPLSSIAFFYEAEEEEETEEPEEEPTEEIKSKYKNRSVDDLPKKKRNGILGWLGR